MDEFDIIKRYFSPLSQAEKGAFGLSDDAAVVSADTALESVYTKDVMIAGVHFFANDDPAMLAQKLLAVNVSDLAAMGATVRGYMLGLALPEHTDETWIAAFSQGLSEGIKRFGGALLGGDTTRHKDASSLVLSLTAIGEVPVGEALRRAGAKVGEDVYVTGTIGDAALGLLLLKAPKNERHLDAQCLSYLKQRYHLPTPRQQWGVELRTIASACIDISDGLVADAGHVAKSSSVALHIDAELMPCSEAAKFALSKGIITIESLLTGGDDYELLFTAPAAARNAIKQKAMLIETPVTRIGSVVEGEGVQVMHSNKMLTFKQAGYQHFS